jgi:hypothetical protein
MSLVWLTCVKTGRCSYHDPAMLYISDPHLPLELHKDQKGCPYQKPHLAPESLKLAVSTASFHDNGTLAAEPAQLQ